jgi:MFS family permease
LKHQSETTGRVDFRSILSSHALTAGLLCVFLGAIDLTVIASILSTIIPDLGVNTADIDRYIWVVNGYLIAYVVAIPLVGRLSDVIGRQPAFFACLAIFAVGSIMCAGADTLPTLILGRTLQGFGGGGLLPVTIALAGDVLARSMRLAGIGLVSAIDTLGWVLGPTWGAVVVGVLPGAEAPWRWVFWLNLPFLAVALFAVMKGFPRHHRDTRASVTSMIDLPGSILLAIALVSINLALASGGEIGAQAGTGLRALGGTPNPMADRIPLLIGIAALSVIGLFLWERRSMHPILPVALLRRGHYVAIVIANFLVGSALMVGMVNVPVIVALVRESDTVIRDSALLLAPLTLFIAIFSLLSGPIASRIGTFRMTAAGILLTVLGYAALYGIVDRDNIWRMVIGLAIAGMGIGLLLAPLSAVALDESDEENRGSAVSTALMFRLLGMTIGMSLLTAAGVYRLQILTGRLEPVVQGVSESTAEYLVRQQQFVDDHVVPLSVQVMQETFLAASGLAALAIVPIILMRDRGART